VRSAPPLARTHNVLTSLPAAWCLQRAACSATLQRAA